MLLDFFVRLILDLFEEFVLLYGGVSSESDPMAHSVRKSACAKAAGRAASSTATYAGPPTGAEGMCPTRPHAHTPLRRVIRSVL